MNAARRLSPLGRQIGLLAVILLLWAPLKLAWEREIERQQNQLRYHGILLTKQLRDQLSQGVAIGILSGMRSVVADYFFLYVTVAWENQQWFKMEANINLCTALQPRSILFWDQGGWQLAWNASVSAAHDLTEPNPLRRLKASRYWIQRGLAVYQRGLAYNPEQYNLWLDTGTLYQYRLSDYRQAAYYYKQALLRPDCPVYLERFPAIMYGLAGDDPAAYAEWKSLWERLTPAQREEPQHWKEKIISNLRRLENKLNIPTEKRVFPRP